MRTVFSVIASSSAASLGERSLQEQSGHRRLARGEPIKAGDEVRVGFRRALRIREGNTNCVRPTEGRGGVARRRDDKRERTAAGRPIDRHDAALVYEQLPVEAARRLENEARQPRVVVAARGAQQAIPDQKAVDLSENDAREPHSLRQCGRRRR